MFCKPVTRELVELCTRGRMVDCGSCSSSTRLVMLPVWLLFRLKTFALDNCEIDAELFRRLESTEGGCGRPGEGPSLGLHSTGLVLRTSAMASLIMLSIVVDERFLSARAEPGVLFVDIIALSRRSNLFSISALGTSASRKSLFNSRSLSSARTCNVDISASL